jgi:hypothetical protein
MQKTTYTCDHCGADVSPFMGEQWRAMFFTVGPDLPDIHGCSESHLGLAVAHAFKIPLGASVDDTMKSAKEIERLQSVVRSQNNEIKRLQSVCADEQEGRAMCQVRCAELEARIATATAFDDPRVDWSDAPRPGVLGGECARCLHVPPLHEQGCAMLLIPPNDGELRDSD